MITIDGKKFYGVTTVLDPINPPRNLVTYTVDGEPSGPLYTEHGSSDTQLAEYLLASEVGKIENLTFWKYDKHENSNMSGCILEQFL